MSIKTFLIVITLAAAYAVEPDCSGSGGADDQECESWSFLRFLWSPTSVVKTTNAVALDAQDVDPSKTTLLSPNCVNTDPTSGATWYGFRQAYNAKQSVIALYDIQGSVAGIQARFLVNSVNPAAQFNHSAVGMFQKETVDGVPYFVLTAYFVDPSTICTQGRPASALTTNNGVGDRLVFQNGKTPAELLAAPRRRADALQQGYSKNNCFATMGIHSFYNVESFTATSCRQIVPVFLLFNKANYLVGFGFDWVGKNTDDSSFESPPSSAITKIVGDMTPPCLTAFADNADISVTTMHVFFVKRNPSPNPWNCS